MMKMLISEKSNLSKKIDEHFEEQNYSMELLIPRIFCKHCDKCFGLTAQDLRASWGMSNEQDKIAEDDKATEEWLLEHVKKDHPEIK